MQVVAGADARTPARSRARAAARSSGVVIFTLRSSPCHDRDRMPGALGQHRLVGGVARRAPPRRDRVAARRAGIPAASAPARARRAESSRRRRPRRPIDALHGVAHRHRRHRRAGRRRRRRSRDRSARARRTAAPRRGPARRRRRRGSAATPAAHRILPPRAAGHDRARRASSRRPVGGRRPRAPAGSTTTSCVTRGMAVERRDAALQHRPAAEVEQLLGHRRAHARRHARPRR